MGDDLISEPERQALIASHGPIYAGLEHYRRWLKRYRNNYPDDDRSELELTELYHAETMQLYAAAVAEGSKAK